MERSHEYELKLMLSEQEYNNLLLFDGGVPYTQKNTYFDTPGFDMYAKQIVIRVRKKKDVIELTVKTKFQGESDAGVISMVENTINLNEAEAAELTNGKISISQYLEEMPVFKDEKLMPIGSITTIRKNICINEKLPVAELDKSTYNGRTDYELEWELEKNKYKSAVKSLGKLGLELKSRRTGMSKYGRFINSMLKGK